MNFEDQLFIKIETARLTNSFYELDKQYPLLAHSWAVKHDNWVKNKEIPSDYGYNDSWIEKSGLQAEYSRIIAFAMCHTDTNNNKKNVPLIVSEYSDENEQQILKSITNILNNHSDMIISGYNIKKFDIPFIVKRLLINNMEVPHNIDFTGKKPWDINVNDYYEIWKSGNMYGASMLDVAAALNLKNVAYIKSTEEINNLWLSYNKNDKSYKEINNNLKMKMGLIYSIAWKIC